MIKGCKLVSFLGTTEYRQLVYGAPPGAPGDAPETFSTPFCPRAIAEFFPCAEYVVLATDEAWQKNGRPLQQAFSTTGIVPQRLAIPDGKNESELRQQFRLLLEALQTSRPLIVDITFGFRPQPFFAATALSVLAGSGDLPQDMRIFYGAMEARTDGVTPIWDLSHFMLMQQLSHGIAAFKHTGHGAPLMAALQRETRRLETRRKAGNRNTADSTRPLLDALQRFVDDLATLRVPQLTIGAGKENSSSRQLLEAISQFRHTCQQDHPALLPLLDDLENMARPLATNTLYGKRGKQAMLALARLYVEFHRPLEAAAILRELLLNLAATSNAATDSGTSRYSRKERQQTEKRVYSRFREYRRVARIRNDMLHAGLGGWPRPAKKLRNDTRALIARLARLKAPDE